MITKRHLLFNTILILFPWVTLLFMNKRDVKRFSFAGIFIVLFEIVNHIYGHKRNWWKFYDKRPSFFRDELPFSIGPYMPLSMWILKFSFENFKKFILLNALANGAFAFFLIDVFNKMKVIGLNRINHIQFFFYLHYKVYLLYGAQYLIEKMGWNR